MSQLKAIAQRLRSLAHDASPLASNVEASARQLKSLGHQVEPLRRAGVNIGPLLAALQQAETRAQAAAHAAARVRIEGTEWADHLARGGSGHSIGTNDTAAKWWERRAGVPAAPGAGGTTLASQPALESSVLERVEAAKSALTRWDQADQAHAEAWFGSASDAVRYTLLHRIEKIEDALGEVELLPFEEGEGGPSVFAYVRPGAAGRSVYVGDLFWSRGNRPPDSQAGVLVHELSHFRDIAGTKDHAYGHDTCLELARNYPDLALNNADNFEYYVEGATT